VVSESLQHGSESQLSLLLPTATRYEEVLLRMILRVNHMLPTSDYGLARWRDKTGVLGLTWHGDRPKAGLP
jgi:hypothetical protein